MATKFGWDYEPNKDMLSEYTIIVPVSRIRKYTVEADSPEHALWLYQNDRDYCEMKDDIDFNFLKENPEQATVEPT